MTATITQHSSVYREIDQSEQRAIVTATIYSSEATVTATIYNSERPKTVTATDQINDQSQQPPTKKRPPIRPKPEQLPKTVTFEDSDRPEQRPITTAADQNVD